MVWILPSIQLHAVDQLIGGEKFTNELGCSPYAASEGGPPNQRLAHHRVRLDFFFWIKKKKKYEDKPDVAFSLLDDCLIRIAYFCISFSSIGEHNNLILSSHRS